MLVGRIGQACFFNRFSNIIVNVSKTKMVVEGEGGKETVYSHLGNKWQLRFKIKDWNELKRRS